MTSANEHVELEQLNVKNIPRKTYQRWQAAAERHGMTLSDWVRTVLSTAATPDKGRILRIGRT